MTPRSGATPSSTERRTRDTRTTPSHEDTRPSPPGILSRDRPCGGTGDPSPTQAREAGPRGVWLAEPLRVPVCPSPGSAGQIDAPCNLDPLLSPPFAKSSFVCLWAFH